VWSPLVVPSISFSLLDPSAIALRGSCNWPSPGSIEVWRASGLQPSDAAEAAALRERFF
jgi:hypothetical protein